jgi:hypothetical protein
MAERSSDARVVGPVPSTPPTDEAVLIVQSTRGIGKRTVIEDSMRRLTRDVGSRSPVTSAETDAAHFAMLSKVPADVLYRFVRRMDLARVPVAGESRKRKEVALDSPTTWWLGVLRGGGQELLSEEKQMLHTRTHVFGLYSHWMAVNGGGSREVRSSRFWEAMKEMMPSLRLGRFAPKDGVRPYGVMLPVYSVAKGQFCAYMKDPEFFSKDVQADVELVLAE